MGAVGHGASCVAGVGRGEDEPRIKTVRPAAEAHHDRLGQRPGGFELAHRALRAQDGGEGLFLARLRGPGRIWLQTMPIYNLARKVASHVHVSGGSSKGGNIAGGVIKGLLGG